MLELLFNKKINFALPLFRKNLKVKLQTEW